MSRSINPRWILLPLIVAGMLGFYFYQDSQAESAATEARAAEKATFDVYTTMVTYGAYDKDTLREVYELAARNDGMGILALLQDGRIVELSGGKRLTITRVEEAGIVLPTGQQDVVFAYIAAPNVAAGDRVRGFWLVDAFLQRARQ